MLRLVYSNRIEELLRALSEAIAAQRAVGSPLAPVEIVVPNRNLERFLELGIAAELGIASNLRFHRLETFVVERLTAAVGPVLDRRMLEAGCLDVLMSMSPDVPTDRGALDDGVSLSFAELEPIAHYLRGAGDDADAIDARRVQLALRLAALFEGYAFSRPEMLAAWQAKRSALPLGAPDLVLATERWQRRMLAHVLAGNPARVLPEAIRAARPEALVLPPALHVFGLSYVARVFQWAFALFAPVCDLSLYVLNPCREFWEDVPTEGELRARRRFGRDELLPESLEDSQSDPPALTYWGRPGREYVFLLNDLSDADFEEHFIEPRGDTVLGALQADVLHRRPERTTPERDADGSIVALASPGVRREVEVVAEEIWRLVRDSSLRFNDIAVFIPPGERNLYLPHLAAAFGEAHSLPHHVVDLPLSADSRVVEAAVRLVDLPFGGFRRPEVLAVLTHPVLRVPGSQGGSTDRSAWVRLVDRLGVYHGLTHADHERTYIDRDLVNWEQAVRRLTLGQFLSSDEHPFEAFGERYFPEDTESDARPAALAALVRSLIQDARFALESVLSLSDWSRFFLGLFRGYLEPRDDREESELRRCLGAAAALAERDTGTHQVRYRVAAELLRVSLESLGGARGEYLADGVVVSSLAPMRAIPFRVIFALGLGEGRFPTTERRDPMDLRHARRSVGDVSPAERDKYVFLEALLSARDRFYVSWVSRDPMTGDTIEPSPVVHQLLEMLGRGYVRDPASLMRRAPLQRHRGDHEAFPEARRERFVATLAEELQRSLGRAPNGDELRRLSEEHRTLESALSLPPLPSHRPSPRDAFRVSLARLRRFLEAPLQGWAEAVLHMRDDRERDLSGLEDEPLRPTQLEAATLLRQAFVLGLSEASAVEPYAELTERLQAEGRWPLGLLADHTRRADHSLLDGWRRVLALTTREAALPRVVRFGGGAGSGEADVVAPTIRFLVRLGDEELPVEIVGRTEALLDSLRASLVLVPRRAPAGVELQRQRLRYGLRGFLDHVALTASGVREESSHRALVLFGGEAAQEASTSLAAITCVEARTYLEQLVADLLARSHGYFLTCDAAFHDPGGWTSLAPGKHAAFVEHYRREGGGLARFGPVPRAWSYPALDPGEALMLTKRRLGLYFRVAGLDRAAVS